jgi:hypothetical protein
MLDDERRAADELAFIIFAFARSMGEEKIVTWYS